MRCPRLFRRRRSLSNCIVVTRAVSSGELCRVILEVVGSVRKYSVLGDPKGRYEVVMSKSTRGCYEVVVSKSTRGVAPEYN
jgi:hypothetical protein